MKHSKSLSIALVAALMFLAPAATADEGAPVTGQSIQEKLIATKADAVVSIKYVLSIAFNVQGQQGEREQNGQVVGVMVDPSGLVMVPADAIAIGPQIMAQIRMMGGEASAKPTNIRVIFPGEDKEYPAILGAKDSKLGLGFILIKDLEGKEPVCVDLSQSVEPHSSADKDKLLRLGRVRGRQLWFEEEQLTEPHYTSGSTKEPP